MTHGMRLTHSSFWPLLLSGLLLASMLLPSFFGVGLANAANVTVTNNVVLHTSVGQLTIVGTEVQDSFAVYANNTIFFDVSSSWPTQVVYTFTAQSYGNGTFTVRVKGPSIGTIATKGHVSTVVAGSRDIIYSGADPGYGATSVLVIDFTAVSHLFRDAAFIMALFTPIVLFVGLAKWSQDPFDPKRPKKMKRLYYVALTLSVSTALLFIMSLMFNV